jgi:hypothetical protein
MAASAQESRLSRFRPARRTHPRRPAADGPGFVRSGNEHANTLQLQLGLRPAGVIGGGECYQAVAAEQADDQFRLGPSPHKRDRHRHVLHGVHLSASSMPARPAAAPGSRPRTGRRARGRPWPEHRAADR